MLKDGGLFDGSELYACFFKALDLLFCGDLKQLRTGMHIFSSNSQDFSIWMFPKTMVPPNHPFQIGFSIIFTIHFGVPHPYFATSPSHYNLRFPFRGRQLQRGDGADALQMARCSGTTGDHAASLGAAQWGNGQCGDERDGEEWVTWRELVMSWMKEVELGGGIELCSFLPKGVVFSRMMQTAVT